MPRAPDESDPPLAPNLENKGTTITPPINAGKQPTYWSLPDILLAGLTATLLMAVVISAVNRRLQQNTRENFVADLLTAKNAFDSFMRDRGTIPADAAIGTIPPGMAPFLANLSWSEPTPVGGNYRWTYRPGPTRDDAPAAHGLIEITAFPPSPRINLSFGDLLEIDRKIDDGNLETGDFRIGFNGWPTLRVTPRR